MTDQTAYKNDTEGGLMTLPANRALACAVCRRRSTRTDPGKSEY